VPTLSPPRTGGRKSVAVWPETLWLVRHGQSAGNVAREVAEAGRLPVIDVPTRDMDTPLSALGQRQALALGKWFGGLPRERQPDALLCSPYRRAWDTARLILEGGGLELPPDALRADERLREKEFGILDRLTVHGIRQQYPILAEQRDHVDKFYFRPPGGESWCDVILRLRSTTDTLARDYGGARLLIVAHEVIVTCFRYLFEALDDASVLALDRAGDVPNCGVTCYENPGGGAVRPPQRPTFSNYVAPLEAGGAIVTREADRPAAPKS
jgi:broad specificity phosphatase PhoE